MLCHMIKSHEEYENIAHRPCSCISSVQEINEGSIEFSLSTRTWSRFKLPWLKSYIICPYCYALHFDCEKLTSLRVNHPKFGICCLQEQIQLPLLQPLTGILHNYLTGNDYSSREFYNNIWQYNAAFAITSVEVKIDNLVTR